MGLLRNRRIIILFLLSICALVLGNTSHIYSHLSPMPDARHISSSSSISVNFQSIHPQELTNLSTFIRVVGKDGKIYPGKTWIAADQKTIVYKPHSQFLSGETVNVTLTPRLAFPEMDPIKPFHYKFIVCRTEDQQSCQSPFDNSERINILNTQSNLTSGKRTAVIMPNGVSVPSDFPHVNITINNNPYDGYLFLNIWRDYHPYNLILDNTGSPIWYLRTPDYDRRRDFKVQHNGVLSMVIRGGYGKEEIYTESANWGHITLDQNYNHIKTYRPVNGYTTDEHEFQILKDGGYFLIGRKDSTVDMSQYVDGGRTNAIVRETVLQEFSSDDSLLYQWSAWKHFDIRDIHSTEDPLTGAYIRFPHMNSVDVDDDGHIILSSRHLSEVTKIHRQTREIIWRLGGEHSDFTFIGDSLNGFSMQHDVRALGNGHYTLFDNSNWRTPSIPRAVEYELDTLNMTATLVWEYPEKPGFTAPYMGNVQQLPNKNRLINWAVNKITEVRPDGEKAFEMSFWDNYHCYRAFRFQWDGMSLVPYLIAESHREAVVLIFNKFGDPNVDYYKIYGDTSPNPTTEIDTSKTTIKILRNLDNQQYYYFRVTAVDIYGQESGYSNEAKALINFIDPGENMILNGDFSNVKVDWSYKKYKPAKGNWFIRDETSYFEISNGGDETWHIQFLQDGLEVICGDSYLFEFDAWADSQRTIEAMIMQNGLSYINYSKTGTIPLTTEQTHYTFPFVMEDPSDFNALVVFLIGASDVDVYLDNISFKRDIEAEVEEHLVQTPQKFDLKGNYPNPFNSETTITFSTQERSRVKITLYNILGKFEQEICNTVYDQGEHQIKFDGNRLSSGIYFYKIEARGINDSQIYWDVRKMIMIK